MVLQNYVKNIVKILHGGQGISDRHLIQDVRKMQSRYTKVSQMYVKVTSTGIFNGMQKACEKTSYM